MVPGLFYLLTLASSTTYRLIEYSASVLNMVQDTVFKHLEVFQTSALQVALGLPMRVCFFKNMLCPPGSNYTNSHGDISLHLANTLWDSQ